MLQKSFRVVRLKFAQHVPDSGQEHLADSDDCLFMTPAGFDPVIPLFKFRVLFGFDQGIGDLDKKRFQITARRGRFAWILLSGCSGHYGDSSQPKR